MFFEGKGVQPVHGPPGRGDWALDDVDGDNFDHGGLGLSCGLALCLRQRRRASDSDTARCHRHARWARMEKRRPEWYHHAANIAVSGSNYANPQTTISDLDPTYRESTGFGAAASHLQFRQNDYKVMEYTLDVAAKHRARDEPTSIRPRRACGAATTTSWAVSILTQHTGHHHGDRPETSVVQPLSAGTWDAHNLFIIGRSTFPATAGYNRPDRSARLALLVRRRGDHLEGIQEPRVRWCRRDPGRNGKNSWGQEQCANRSRPAILVVLNRNFGRGRRCRAGKALFQPALPA